MKLREQIEKVVTHPMTVFEIQTKLGLFRPGTNKWIREDTRRVVVKVTKVVGFEPDGTPLREME